MKNTFSFILLCFILLGYTSCVSVTKIKDGMQAFTFKKYILAIDLLKKEIASETDEILLSEKMYALAESYEKTEQPALAASMYAKAIENGYNQEAILKQVEMLKIQEKYDEAIKILQSYLQKKPAEKLEITAMIRACENAIIWKNNKTGIKLENLNINSEYADFSPVLDPFWNLIFTSSRTNAKGELNYDWNEKKFYDLFQANIDLEKMKVDSVSSINYLNTDFHEGPCSFSKNGEMYYSKCGSKGNIDNYCSIYFRQLDENQKWGSEQQLLFFENPKVNCIQPFVSNDGRTLYFSSDAEDGLGGFDLYVCYATGSGWGDPQNLGASVNTEGSEMFPTLDENNNLFFSSDTWPGMGGLDIFSAKNLGKKYAIENLKHPFNSGADDFGMLKVQLNAQDKKDSILQKGFFSSNRIGGKGMDDIYSFLEKPLPPEPKINYALEIVVLEKLYTDSLNPNSIVLDSLGLENAEILISIENEIEPFLWNTNEKGQAFSEIDSTGILSIKVQKKGYFTQSKKLPLITQKKFLVNGVITTKATFVLEKIFKNKEIVLDDIFYDYDSTAIRSDAALVLDTLVILLNENPDLKIQMGSHTDCRGKEAYNEKLSQGRAEKAVLYLVSKGILKDRLSAKGYGESEPISCLKCDNCSEEEHQKNRRTTFKVLE